MSWHFLQGQEAASWEASSLDGAPFALSSLLPTAAPSCSHGSETDVCHDFRSGMTCGASTESPGEGASMSSLAVSPARTSALPAEELASAGSDQDSGPRWPESFARYDRDTHSWKTRQLSLLGGSESFSETWPRWGTMRTGECWEQTMPVLPIVASGSGLSLPTPTVQDAHGRDRHNQQDGSVILSLLGRARMWPTPVSTDGSHGGRVTPREGREGGNLIEAVSEQIGGQLNPTWVELLMGWPAGWTSAEPLDSVEFLRWWQSANHWTAGWEDGVPRVVTTLPDRVARLTAIGNGQVPAVVAGAWETLRQ